MKNYLLKNKSRTNDNIDSIFTTAKFKSTESARAYLPRFHLQGSFKPISITQWKTISRPYAVALS